MNFTIYFNTKMSCTKFFNKGQIRERLFKIFDKDKPFELKLQYLRLIPKTEGGSGLGFIGFGNMYHYTDVQKITYTKEVYKRFKSREEAQKMINDINNGMCLKCGNIDNCKKSKYIMNLLKKN